VQLHGRFVGGRAECDEGVGRVVGGNYGHDFYFDFDIYFNLDIHFHFDIYFHFDVHLFIDVHLFFHVQFTRSPEPVCR